MGGDTCVAFGCKTNYATCKEKVSVFGFPDPVENPDLHQKWVDFVNRPSPWKPGKRAVLCAHHFDKKIY